MAKLNLNLDTIQTLKRASTFYKIPLGIMVNVIYVEERKFWKTQKETCDAILEDLAEGSIS